MHRGVMLRTSLAAASAFALALGAGCGECDDCGGFGGTVARTALLALARADAAAPAPTVTTIPVRHNQSRTALITHPDVGSTPFVELFFPSQSILHLNGQPVCDTCTVTVTVTATPGVYGLTITPAGMIFNAAGTPTVTFGYNVYGNFAVRDSSTLYPTDPAFDVALAVWYEATPGQWRRGRNSSHTAPGRVVSGIEGPGALLLAAPK
jgi:hypothetical protein